jgi:hypothetical protein
MQIAPKQISLRLPREGLLKNHNVEFGLILLAIRHPAHHPQWCAFFLFKLLGFPFLSSYHVVMLNFSATQTVLTNVEVNVTKLITCFAPRKMNMKYHPRFPQSRFVI